MPRTPRPPSAPPETGPDAASKNRNRITFIEQLGPNLPSGADDYQWIVLKAMAGDRYDLKAAQQGNTDAETNVGAITFGG
jgi:hypothetical protein